MKILTQCISNISRLSGGDFQHTQQRLDNLTKPKGSLGRLEELACRLVGISGNTQYKPSRKCVVTMAADHGVTAEGVSAYPSEVTYQMVLNFLRGGAAINVLARQAGARVLVVDMGVNKDFDAGQKGLLSRKIGHGTANMAQGPAMTKGQAIACVETGIALVEEMAAEGVDLIGTGDMGIGNTTASAAIVAAALGLPAAEVTGMGTGIDESAWIKKVQVIEKALALNKPDPKDGLDLLAKVGGFEIGGLAGVILGAARHRVPVLVDGFNSGAAALIAQRLCPAATEVIIASHCSVEKGHRHALRALGLQPLLDLNMRLGEGTGAALAMHLAEASVRILNEMATFGEAGVSKKSEKTAIS